jgi:hypothetical protein
MSIALMVFAFDSMALTFPFTAFALVSKVLALS